MVNKELLDFIRQNLKQGSTEEQIRISLRDNGWQDADVTEAFKNISPFSMSNKNILIIALAGLIIIAAIFAYFVFFRQSGSVAPTPTASVSKTPSPAATASPNPNALGPRETYLAYKQQLYYHTQTGEEVFALFAKYRLAIIYNEMIKRGVGDFFKGVKGNPNDFDTIKAFIKSQTLTSPDPFRISQDLITVETTNPTSVILHATAEGGYKGTINMVLENGSWKIDQELWPTWPVDMSKL